MGSRNYVPARRVDANQPEIVKALRSMGASVQPIHVVGKGCPDLLVGWRNTNWLFEVKDGSLPPSRRELTDDEVKFAQGWRGQVATVETVEDCFRVMGVYPAKG